MQFLKNILCPVDFSPGSEAAVRQAAHLAALYKANLTLLHVLPNLPAVFNLVYGLDLSQMVNLEDIRQQSAEMLSQAAKDWVPAAISCKQIIRKGRISDEILACAAEEKCDLIILSTRGAQEPEDEVFGTHASTLVRKAPCPVMVLPGTDFHVSFKTIVVPVEHSFGIREIRKYLKAYFGIMDPRIHLVSVLKPEADAGDDSSEVKFLNMEKAWLQKDGFSQVSTEVAHSADVAGEIFRTAEAVGAELIMLNTHGRSGLGRLVAGSVTEAVLRHSAFPVLTLRPGRGEVANFSYHSWFPV